MLDIKITSKGKTQELIAPIEMKSPEDNLSERQFI